MECATIVRVAGPEIYARACFVCLDIGAVDLSFKSISYLFLASLYHDSLFLESLRILRFGVAADAVCFLTSFHLAPS